ncbi:uncharacterized protein B0I36DRAFT_313459 [Microdochium trichocladiopsis]|uniref:Uncharacterized protein n=1 Tax=Microdochium trichocladiopsis TaxID=1682393 RepID=A0A9P8YFQ6_9PEZI|nr:uncharacterized protein B0I36DRAFT_313459 [Microdochium trichocladiopsis]KAH7037170.1 hypothetical protein B0I36DRAFT_313459 [Microdochium trichocladiopsis]
MLVSSTIKHHRTAVRSSSPMERDSSVGRIPSDKETLKGGSINNEVHLFVSLPCPSPGAFAYLPRRERENF